MPSGYRYFNTWMLFKSDGPGRWSTDFNRNQRHEREHLVVYVEVSD